MPDNDCHVPAGATGEPPGEDAPIAEGVLVPGAPLVLHHGGVLPAVELAWRIDGATHLPVVVALGGISAGRNVCGTADGGQGWWSTVVGPRLAIDTTRVRVLGIDYLGGSGGSTGPGPGQGDFPPISSFDQAALLESLRSHLGIDRYAAIIGASYGGMVALAFAQRHPRTVRHIGVISAAHRAHPLSTAWRSVQRRAVRFGIAKNDGAGGLKLARALAMATYRTAREFEARFGGEPSRDGDRFVFPVEEYLFSRGDAYAQRYRPESFVCLSESIDLHRVDPAAIRVPATLVAVLEDQLVPLADMRALARGLAGPCALHEISSLYGHDAFLKENDMLKPLLSAALEGQRP